MKFGLMRSIPQFGGIGRIQKSFHIIERNNKRSNFADILQMPKKSTPKSALFWYERRLPICAETDNGEVITHATSFFAIGEMFRVGALPFHESFRFKIIGF